MLAQSRYLSRIAAFSSSSFYSYPVLNMPADREDATQQSNFKAMSTSNLQFQEVINGVLNYGGTTAH